MSEYHTGDRPTHAPHEMTDHSPPRSWLGALGVLLALAGLAALDGLGGLLAGGILVACWYVVDTLYTVALGQLLVAASAPTGESLPWVVVAELGLFLVLAELVSDEDDTSRTTAEMAVVLVGLLGCVWATSQLTDDLWVVSTTLCAVVVVALYGVHRYGLVRLRLVEDES